MTAYCPHKGPVTLCTELLPIENQSIYYIINYITAIHGAL